ncbi:uncharacterized protein [Aristolochia californica]|uniref:uncharacterized protein n=1 Tax=Aristolochia californica TaxID=171875 RepID=UPI0035DE82C6
MYAAWSSFKENMNCSQLRVTAVFRPEMVKNRKDGDGKVNRKREITCVEREYHASDEKVWQNSGPERFRGEYSTFFSLFTTQLNALQMVYMQLELKTGDISRNVVTIIFHTTSIWKQVRKIERILKVTNLPEVLEKFEDYREMTELCCNATCGVCRIIQPVFRADDAKINETRLSASSNRHCKGTGRRGEENKAVVLCRVIAGTVPDVADTAEGSKMGLFDSYGREDLSVINRHGILPCFVITYS